MSQKWFTFLVVALIAGAAAGVAGAIATESYLDRYAAELASGSTPPRLGDERPRTSPGSYQESLVRVRERLLPSVVSWHRRLPETASVVRGSYTADGALGAGVVISSDGWVLTSADVFRAGQASQMVAVIDARVYDVLEAKEDAATGALLVKLDGANLPVVSFGDDTALGILDPLFAASTPTRMAAGFVAAILEEDILTTSETFPVGFELDLGQELAAGSPVVNVFGDVVGFLQADGALRPLSSVRPVIQRILKGEDAARPRLGVSVAMLDRAIGHEAYGVGALVVDRPAVGTPAREADVRMNDVILRAGGRDVGGGDTLARILLDYKPGDVITLSVKRGTETFDVNVTLDAF